MVRRRAPPRYGPRFTPRDPPRVPTALRAALFSGARRALLASLAGLFLFSAAQAQSQQAPPSGTGSAAAADQGQEQQASPSSTGSAAAANQGQEQQASPSGAGSATAATEEQEQQTPPPASGSAAAAAQLADIFSKIGDQLFEECIFELSDEQLLAQAALIEAYMERGADGTVARRLAATQIQPPKLTEKCEALRRTPEAPDTSWVTTLTVPPKKPAAEAGAKRPAQKKPAVIAAALKGKKGLPQWDCAAGVDFVTVHLNGYERKLTGGEICNPYQDVVHEVPASLPRFRLGYTIRTGRLFIIADGAPANGQTIAWAISGRDVCRNNPDPDCFAARAVGPLPPGEYAFAAEPAQRINWGPRTKRHVAGIYLRKLWNKERFTPEQTAAILARSNIAIHVRLKGEMSEACIGLEPKGWAYVASLIKEGRATGLEVHIDEPYPQVAEAPPLVVASSFSLTSLFK